MPAPQIAPPATLNGRKTRYAHPRHPGQARDQHPQRGGEPAEEHGPATAPGQVLLRPLDPVGFQDPAERPGLQQPVTVLAAHQVPRPSRR